LEELRFRLFILAVTVVAGLAVFAYIGGDLIGFLKEPAEARNQNSISNSQNPSSCSSPISVWPCWDG